MTVAHLGQQVKRLHPQAYQSVSDHVVGRAMKSRFPGMYEDFADSVSPSESGTSAKDSRKIPERFPKDIDANTIPETPKTLSIQLDQLKQGIRRVVFIARGSKVHPNPADFGARKLTLPSGEYYYKPDMIRPQEIIKAVANHELNEILGSATEGYGAKSKDDLSGPISAVVSRDGQGNTVHSALADEASSKSAITVANELKPPGGSVSVEHPAKEIANRLMAARKNRGARWPKPQTPKKENI